MTAKSSINRGDNENTRRYFRQIYKALFAKRNQKSYWSCLAFEKTVGSLETCKKYE